jgi:branched-chain amino acid transport system substrate-binding protein
VKRRIATIACAAAALLAQAGCGPAADESATGPLTVYVSAPLHGEDAAAGRDIADGASLALDDAGAAAGEVEVGLETLDAADGPGAVSGWSPAAVGRNARAAAQDTSAIAYIGDLESGATRVSLPITNQAFVPQVSPGATAIDLAAPPDGGTEVPEDVQSTGERTFLRVIPDDKVQAEAAAAWARKLGAERVAVVSDGSAFGDQITEEFAEAAAALGIGAEESRPDEEPASGIELIYLGLDRVDEGLSLDLSEAGSTDPPLMSSDALAGERALPDFLMTASAQDPEQLPAPGQDFAAAFESEYDRAPGPYAAYGYEAMALVLDAIERAGGEAEDRSAVLDELLATADRDSVLGTYSITAIGNTTLDAIAGYRVRDGQPVFDEPLAAP